MKWSLGTFLPEPTTSSVVRPMGNSFMLISGFTTGMVKHKKVYLLDVSGETDKWVQMDLEVQCPDRTCIMIDVKDTKYAAC